MQSAAIAFSSPPLSLSVNPGRLAARRFSARSLLQQSEWPRLGNVTSTASASPSSTPISCSMRRSGWISSSNPFAESYLVPARATAESTDAAEVPQSKSTDAAEVPTLFGFWYLFNIYFNIYNKQVLKVYPYPVTVSLVQFAVGTVIVFLMWTLNIYKRPAISGSQLAAILPLAVVHTLGNLFTNMSLGKVAVSFTHTIKAMEPFFSVVLSAMFLGEGLNVKQICIRSLRAALYFHAYQQMYHRRTTSPPPPTSDASGLMLAWLTRFFEQHIGTARRERPEAVYERFRKMGPREFSGAVDPFVAEDWIKSLEEIFEVMEMPDGDRVRCTKFMLRGDASLWWEGASKSVDVRALTWEGFKGLFFEKYFTEEVRTRLRREFMNLTQGDMSVAEFVRRFDRGCHFMPLIADNAGEKLRHFVEGLRPVIKKDVLVAPPVEYAAAVASALRVERLVREMKQDTQRKRQAPQTAPLQGKRQNSGPSRQQRLPARQPQRPPTAQSDQRPLCTECQRHHFGKCLAKAGVCFKCKSPGHMSSACPQLRQPVPGRVFVMQAEQADPDSTLITGEDFEETRGGDA